MNVFTPLNSSRTQRLRFNAEDVKTISGNPFVRKLGKKAVVEIKGKRYQVYGAACSLPQCVCDAYIKELTA